MIRETTAPKTCIMKTSITTIGLLAALAVGLTSPRPFHRRPSVYSPRKVKKANA
jgi:hypothetical protein